MTTYAEFLMHSLSPSSLPTPPSVKRPLILSLRNAAFPVKPCADYSELLPDAMPGILAPNGEMVRCPDLQPAVRISRHVPS